MSLNPKWVPMKWPCGPLEIYWLNEFNREDDEFRKAAEMWAQPSALQLLSGTPINCLIVDWALGKAEDEAQQKTLKPLIQAGRQLGLSFVGVVSVQDNLAAVVAAGREAGLEAVMLNAPANQPLDLPYILQVPNESVQWELMTPIFSTKDNVWPRGRLSATENLEDGATPDAGPTASPGLYSNGWVSLLARGMAPGKVLWLAFDPRDSADGDDAETIDIVSVEKYCLAIADSQVYGSRWIISLDNGMRMALLKKNPSAINTWNQICGTLSFFENHTEWQTYEPMAVLAVVSNFGEANAYTSTELLDLLNRRQVQFRVMNRAHALAASDTGIKGVLWLDEEAPDAEQQNRLLAFVRQGGIVIAAKYWGPGGVTPYKENWLFGYSIYSVGNGKLFIADEQFPDPYQLDRDINLLVSRKNDFVRVYNPGVTKYYSTIDPESHNQVVHILNYSVDPATYVTLWVDKKVQTAQLWRPKPLTSPPIKPLASQSIEDAPASEGTNFDLPPLSVNCAIEIKQRA